MDKVVFIFGIGLVAVRAIAAATIACCARIWSKHRKEHK
jgi:uncharacterized membrane protein YjjB (DUF3815 family)